MWLKYKRQGESVFESPCPLVIYSLILDQVLAGLECYCIPAFDLDRKTCLRISAFTGFPIDLFKGIHVSGMTCNMDIRVLDPAVELDPQPSLEGGARNRQQQ